MQIQNNKIAFISPNAYPLLYPKNIKSSGGAERQLVLLARYLQKSGFEPIFITDNHNISDRPLFNILKTPFSNMGRYIFFHLRDLIIFWQTLKKTSAEYYILKNPRFLTLFIGIYCRINKRKLIFWSQNDPNYIPKKGLAKYFAFLILKVGIKLSDFVISQTLDQKHSYKRIFNVRSIHIPNIYVPPVILTKNNMYRSDILWVGNPLKCKNYEVVLELAKYFPDNKIIMIMNKGNTSQEENRFKRARTDSQNYPNCHFVGQVSQKIIDNYFYSTKVFINTSHYEGFPNTFLQALYLKKPIVSLFFDPDDLLTKNKFGTVCLHKKDEFLFYQKKFQKLAKKMKVPINKYLSAKGFSNKIGIQAKKYIIQNHFPDKIISKLIPLIKN